MKGSAVLPCWIAESLFSDEEVRADGLAEIDGILGAQFFESFGALFDYGSGQFFYNPHNLVSFDSRLEGNWGMTFFYDGAKMRFDPAIRKAKMVIKGNRLRYYDSREWREYQIFTAPWKDEPWIDLVGIAHEDQMHGLFLVSGSTLTLALAPTNTTRPRYLEADRMEGHILIELRK